MGKLMEYKLWQEKKRVYFQIIKMDESLRNNKNKTIKIKEMQIESYTYPRLFEYVIFIRGIYKEYDKDVIYVDFKTVKKAEEYCIKVKEALDLFCKYGFDYKEEDYLFELKKIYKSLKKELNATDKMVKEVCFAMGKFDKLNYEEYLYFQINALKWLKEWSDVKNIKE